MTTKPNMYAHANRQGAHAKETSLTMCVCVQMCAPGYVPSADNPCELGARATDPEDGPLTYNVYACPPLSCLTNCTGCMGHELAVKGIKGCVNTSQVRRSHTHSLSTSLFLTHCF